MGNFSSISKIIGLIFLGALYFFWFDIKSAFYTPPTSVVDATCGKLWVARAQNDPALACYLQQKISRLCSPSEREHLNWIFQRYAHDKTAFGQDMAVTLAMVNLNWSKQLAENPTGDVAAALNSANATVANDLKVNGIAAAMNVDMIPRSTLVAMLRHIITQGLIEKSDFDRPSDSLVAEAFVDIESSKISAKRTCK